MWKNSVPWVIKEIQIKIRHHALSVNMQNNFAQLTQCWWSTWRQSLIGLQENMNWSQLFRNSTMMFITNIFY